MDTRSEFGKGFILGVEDALRFLEEKQKPSVTEDELHELSQCVEPEGDAASYRIGWRDAEKRFINDDTK